MRDVEYHRRYPLFASAGDDNNIVVSHGMVYNDLLQVGVLLYYYYLLSVLTTRGACFRTP